MSEQSNAEHRRRAVELASERAADAGEHRDAQRARDAVVVVLKSINRRRQYAMKCQQKLDRALESYVRINHTEWSPDLDEKERKKLNDKALALIGAARKGEGHDDVIDLVEKTDQSRKVWDEVRSASEKQMEAQAKRLAISTWIASVHGVSILGLAKVLAATGPLDNYANPEKVFKRLGLAPYEGHAGSTWRYPTKRSRTLTSEEWVEVCYSPAKYSDIWLQAKFLWTAQWIGKSKTEDGVGRPKGPYGEIYQRRREHTMAAHPDWTPQHLHFDACRVMFKKFLAALWEQYIDLAWANDEVQADARELEDA